MKKVQLMDIKDKRAEKINTDIGKIVNSIKYLKGEATKAALAGEKGSISGLKGYSEFLKNIEDAISDKMFEYGKDSLVNVLEILNEYAENDPNEEFRTLASYGYEAITEAMVREKVITAGASFLVQYYGKEKADHFVREVLEVKMKLIMDAAPKGSYSVSAAVIDIMFPEILRNFKVLLEKSDKTEEDHMNILLGVTALVSIFSALVGTISITEATLDYVEKYKDSMRKDVSERLRDINQNVVPKTLEETYGKVFEKGSFMYSLLDV
jgi:hypothetical protein